MTYVTQAELLSRFGEDELRALTDRDRSGEIDAAVVDAAIADTAGEINAWLQSGGVKTPLQQPPPFIRLIAADIARYRLYDDHATETVRQRYEDARRLLEKIGNGQLSIGHPGEVTTGTVGRAEFVQGSTTVTDALGDF